MGFNAVLPKSKYESEIISAVDESNTAYAVAPYAGAFTIHGSGLNVAVPPGDRPIYLQWDIQLKCTTSGTGFVEVGVGEMVSGVLTVRGLSGMGGTFTASGVYPPFMGNCPGSLRVPPSSSWRFYHLFANLFRDSGSFACQQLASSIGTPSTFLRVVQG